MTYNILMYGVMTSDEKQDFYKNPVIDKYTIINHHLDEKNLQKLFLRYLGIME